MHIRMSKELVNAIGIFPLKMFGVELNQFQWQNFVAIDLSHYDRDKLTRLYDLIKDARKKDPKLKTAGTAFNDMERWFSILDHDAKDIKPRTVEQFASALHVFMYSVEGHRLYYQDAARGVHFAYYVGKIEYHAEYEEYSPRRTVPARCDMELFYMEFGDRHKLEIIFHAESCTGQTVQKSLAERGFTAETLQLRQEYLTSLKRYRTVTTQIGSQYRAVGMASTHDDGNRRASEEESYWWRESSVNMERGDPAGARVVIDVFRETDKEPKYYYSGSDYMDKWFWERAPFKETEAQKKKNARKRGKPKDDEDEEDKEEKERDITEALEATDEDALERARKVMFEVPVHQTCVVFDLSKHKRLRMHVSQLTEYQYDVSLGEKLVLPEESRQLINMMLEHGGSGFTDIIAGKGGGAIILNAGPPGTGKTLTAEVYAEVTQRPLYSVQCSQLGMVPDDLEAELLRTFLRAQRWNAILLMDEADVYVAARGSDLTQNAIVGVFLRVLEYYKGIMFMNTNRSDLVDDAITSRCIARINYKYPPAEDLRRIWRILADVAKIPLTDKTIVKLVGMWPHLSGRDVKNLLKLASLVVSARKAKEVTPEMITFVKTFKPTVDKDESHEQ
jgi:ATP-dependent 26S proteasome regulatory subunit